MFEYLRRQRQAWQRLRDVRRDEKLIHSLITLHRYNLLAPFEALGIPVVMDPTMESGAVLYFTVSKTTALSLPQATVQLHPHASSADRRLALGMLLVHLSITHTETAYTALPPYVVYASDLESATGPTHNQQWMEYMQAMDLLLPVADFRALGKLFPQNPAYAMTRVMDVSYKTITERAKGISLNIGPVLPKNFHPIIKRCAAR